ncbi:cytoplasmic protein [Salmonella enterica subsp. enterica serovar Newport]|uniref:Cytoplasmic protein n=2 Tax=Salmonella enterica TaxID=28901 RepID=A0A761S9K9_SALER|nr:cytoplasmic protein [Salmonella enterica subsp. enterica serovar Bispebjerg]EAA3705934.1 cytoplasmic protein [Salmonella enterica subsp. enterica serovar Newport]EAP1717176.1 cytoplasmic protein [Salmonella enterica]EBX1108256.1 cytoplasmic protein [Salmonella enterica subsp. enterica serovar Salford]ECF6912628.1 cytoplasmic protein [Salmonella enterica subsp. enterica]EHK8785505.1 cytoplasmic protein [Salmonella enterica subsp. enterica serovar Bardo]HER1246903.1 cytoplasmic protein [Salm
MRISEQALLSVLRQGGCIRSFWRRSARLTGTPAPVVPDGLVLETPGERGDTPLSHVDFAVVAKSLACSDEWSQVVGGTEFGGAVWRLTPGASL